MNFRLSIFVITALLCGAAGYRTYQDRIPNGDHVPHPCKPNFIWRGVGHMNPLGGGQRNPFGEDFARLGKQWNKELCELDSDGDGQTNGQELGDPNCVWTPGQFPARTTGISHPGVCDPWGSELCKGKNIGITCDTGEFNCSYVREPHVRNFTLRFPKTIVPAEETSYMCMTFDLEFPDDDPPGQEYHIIGTEPIIDNPNVMHHITVFSCSQSAKAITTPTLCYMSQDGCFNMVGLWTLGMSGECINKDAGFKITRGSQTRLMMQFHWTNPERVTDYEDSSGMLIYYTPVLRKYNAGVFITGETNLVIPPGQPRVEKKSSCTSECTARSINGSVFLASGLNHMHYLGIEQNVELFRDDKKIRDLTPDQMYSYDNPMIHVYDPPQELYPGDRLDTTCVYRSLSRTRTTYFGEGTFDEMCYGIFTVFPIEHLWVPTCTTWGDIDECRQSYSYMKNCNKWKFNNLTNPDTIALRRLILDNCNFYGACRPECPAAIAKAMEHPCMQDDIRDYILHGIGFSQDPEEIKFLAALRSCDCHHNEGNSTQPCRIDPDVKKADRPGSGDPVDPIETDSAATLTSTLASLIMALAVTFNLMS